MLVPTSDILWTFLKKLHNFFLQNERYKCMKAPCTYSYSYSHIITDPSTSVSDPFWCGSGSADPHTGIRIRIQIFFRILFCKKYKFCVIYELIIHVYSKKISDFFLRNIILKFWSICMRFYHDFFATRIRIKVSCSGSGSETQHSTIPTLFFCSAFMDLTSRSKTYNLNPHLICWPWLQSSPSSPRGRARGARCPWARVSSGYRPRASASVERASSPGPRIQYKS